MLFIKSSICIICAYSDFFWSANCTVLVSKLCLLFQTILDLWPVLILGIFSSLIIKKAQFQFLVSFLVVFFWSVNCANQICIAASYFKHGQCFIWGFLVFRFLAFSVLSILNLLFSAIFPDLEMLKFWSVKYTFIFDVSQILDNTYIWMFLVNSESVILLTLVKYMLCIHFTQNCLFLYFLEAQILLLWRKIVENLLISVHLFCQKTVQLISQETFITQEWLVIESSPNLVEPHF